MLYHLRWVWHQLLQKRTCTPALFCCMSKPRDGICCVSHKVNPWMPSLRREFHNDFEDRGKIGRSPVVLQQACSDVNLIWNNFKCSSFHYIWFRLLRSLRSFPSTDALQTSQSTISPSCEKLHKPLFCSTEHQLVSNSRWSRSYTAHIVGKNNFSNWRGMAKQKYFILKRLLSSTRQLP